MRKIRIAEHISLDGVIQPGGPNEDSDYAHGGWTAPYRSAAGASRSAVKWIALGSIFILSHLAWAFDWGGDSIKDGYRAAELNAARAQNAPLQAAPPQTLSFAIYSLTPLFGDRKLIAEGTRVYSPADIRIELERPPEEWRKTLEIDQGFSIGTSIYREPKIDGFGLWIRKNGEGFSWEWFDLVDGEIFRRRQGAGRVKVRMRSIGGEEELASIEFLDDVVLRLQIDAWWQVIPFIDKETHELVVKKGSVFWLAP